MSYYKSLRKIYLEYFNEHLNKINDSDYELYYFNSYNLTIYEYMPIFHCIENYMNPTIVINKNEYSIKKIELEDALKLYNSIGIDHHIFQYSYNIIDKTNKNRIFIKKNNICKTRFQIIKNTEDYNKYNNSILEEIVKGNDVYKPFILDILQKTIKKLYKNASF